MNNPRTLIGGLLVVVGLVGIWAIDLIVPASLDLDPFEQVERRIPGGAILGLGLVIMNLRPWTPWLSCAASAIAWMTIGALTGRLIGLVYVMGSSPRQWMWVAIELGVIAIAFLYLRRADNPASSAIAE